VFPDVRPIGAVRGADRSHGTPLAPSLLERWGTSGAMRTMRRIARSATCWALAGLVSFASAGRADGPSDAAFFRGSGGAIAARAIALPDRELDRLRGGHVESAQPPKGPRKRVVLWDEARTTPAPRQLDPRNAIVIRGAAGVGALPRGTTR